MADEETRPAVTEDETGGKKPKKDKKDKTQEKKGANPEDEDEDEDSGTLSIILVTIFIVIVWLAILALLVKLDIGGFGSGVLEPVLKDVPYVNRILPGYSLTASGNSVSEDSVYAGYKTVDEAVARIKQQDDELAQAQVRVNDYEQTIADLQAEVARLKTYENNQVEFEKIKDEFYNEVVFGSNSLDISEYQKYYETIDPTNAQILYKQVVQQVQTDKEIQDYAKAYSAMKAKDAAEIFNTMTSDLNLVAKILGAMGTDARGQILAQMDADTAAKVTKLMEPSNSKSSSVPSVTTPTTTPKAEDASSEASEEEDKDKN